MIPPIYQDLESTLFYSMSTIAQTLAGAIGLLSTDILVYHSTLTWELQHEHSIRSYFWRALVASGGMIVVAFIGVTLAPELAQNPRLGRAVLIFAIAGSTMCLVLYGVLFRIVLNSNAEKVIGKVDRTERRGR
jgi:hypothetical protein